MWALSHVGFAELDKLLFELSVLDDQQLLLVLRSFELLVGRLDLAAQVVELLSHGVHHLYANGLYVCMYALNIRAWMYVCRYV